MGAPKASFQPLLAPGRCVLTVEQSRALCVDAFSTSPNRASLFSELERLISFVEEIGVPCWLWVDGSYLTEKEEPGDIDVVYEFWPVDADSIDMEKFNDIMTLNGGKKFSKHLDTYVCPRFLREDSRHNSDLEAYWGEKWGKGWDDWLKGYVVIAIGKTDVQRRLIA